MGTLLTVARREFAGYFATPVAAIFLIIFLALASAFTFFVGYFLERGNADLQSFFMFHPWLYLFMAPALSMRLWAEERRQGTIELFLTLPIPVWAAVLGKFLAAWLFLGLALALTFPMWITVNVLGEPDNGVILASYLGSFLMAGGYVAIGSCLSAATKNQVIAFVVTVTVCFLMTAGGAGFVTDLISEFMSDDALKTVAGLSVLPHFNQIVKGVIDARDVVYFVALMAAWLLATMVVVDSKKAG
ncbi:MAG: ABC transporter permease subunit [Alphaproteobacteria bacterium]|nr:ABC transporter permease subunit [Alphaproteobacteria bacterium]